MRPVNGSVLGATKPRASGMSNATMAALEDVLRIEPYKKPDLRKFIAESYSQSPSLRAVVRSFKRQMPRHHDSYRLALSLCHVARTAGSKASPLKAQ